MMGVVGSEEDVKVSVVGSVQGQLQHEQRSMHSQRQKYDRRQGDRPPEIARFHGNRSPPQLCEQLFDSTRAGKVCWFFVCFGRMSLAKVGFPQAVPNEVRLCIQPL